MAGPHPGVTQPLDQGDEWLEIFDPPLDLLGYKLDTYEVIRLDKIVSDLTLIFFFIRKGWSGLEHQGKTKLLGQDVPMARPHPRVTQPLDQGDEWLEILNQPMIFWVKS